jgi:hypothetical protein
MEHDLNAAMEHDLNNVIRGAHRSSSMELWFVVIGKVLLIHLQEAVPQSQPFITRK